METVKKLSKGEILNETIKYYSEDTSRRCTDEDGSCVYNGYKGLESIHCAVGRCFKPEYKAQGMKFKGNSDVSVIDLLEKRKIKSVDTLLEPQYQGHEVEFWFELQHLHDITRHWIVNDLSEIGIERVKWIKERFGITE